MERKHSPHSRGILPFLDQSRMWYSIWILSPYITPVSKFYSPLTTYQRHWYALLIAAYEGENLNG